MAVRNDLKAGGESTDLSTGVVNKAGGASAPTGLISTVTANSQSLKALMKNVDKLVGSETKGEFMLFKTYVFHVCFKLLLWMFLIGCFCVSSSHYVCDGSPGTCSWLLAGRRPHWLLCGP